MRYTLHDSEGELLSRHPHAPWDTAANLIQEGGHEYIVAFDSEPGIAFPFIVYHPAGNLNAVYGKMCKREELDAFIATLEKQF